MKYVIWIRCLLFLHLSQKCSRWYIRWYDFQVFLLWYLHPVIYLTHFVWYTPDMRCVLFVTTLICYFTGVCYMLVDSPPGTLLHLLLRGIQQHSPLRYPEGNKHFIFIWFFMLLFLCVEHASFATCVCYMDAPQGVCYVFRYGAYLTTSSARPVISGR